MPIDYTPQIIYNQMIDVTQYSKVNQVLNRIKKLEQPERVVALEIIKNPNLATSDQKTLDSIGTKLFTEVSQKKKNCGQKIVAILKNLFGYRIASRRLINPLLNAQKVVVQPTTQAQLVTPVIPKQLSLMDQFLVRLQNGSPIQQKKAVLYSEAKKSFEAHNCPNNLTTHQKVFDNPSSWLTQPFQPKPIQFQTRDGFFDYKPVGNKPNAWVDFSNAYFGGGTGEEGFVQEEIMMTEIYDLFKLFVENESEDKPFWCKINTRVGNKSDRHQVGNAVPSPLYIQNAHRVQQIKGVYGTEINKFSKEELAEKIIPLDQPQQTNILALAAPYLNRPERDEQFDPETLKDIFNQIMAGFTLAHEKDPNLVIHSGRFGCGVFNNSAKAVWFLHRLAAEQLGIDVVLYAYPEDYEKEWTTLSEQFQKQNSLLMCINILSDYLLKN